MGDKDDKFVFEKVQLHCPPLEEVAKVLEKGLKKNFADVAVNVVDCPDLTEKPFMLASKGLCGSPRVADVGGVPHLQPVPNKEKMIANIKTGTDGSECINNTHIAKIIKEENKRTLVKARTTKFTFMGNLFISEGKPGKILEVKAARRTGEQNYMLGIRKILEAHYGTKSVILGGTFLIERGKARLHIMPDFASCPLDTNEKVDNWLRFFEMPAPLTCVGYLVSHDPGLDLRIEHFHCFSDHGDGGHYHNDTTADEVEYRGYLNVAEYMYRIDRPRHTHHIGWDD